MKTRYAALIVIVLSLVLLAACAAPATAPAAPAPTALPPTSTALPPAPTATLDPCSPQLLPGEIDKVAAISNRFDDITFMAQSTPTEQLAAVIIKLQEIRFDAQDHPVPACLDALKQGQLDFMAAVVETMINFMGGETGPSIQDKIDASRQVRQGYDAELSRLLGIPYATPPPLPTAAIKPTSTPAPVTATTKQDMYILLGPGLNYPAAGTFLVNQVTNATGRSEANDWVQLGIPGKPGEFGWVPVQLVQLSGALSDLPVVEPPAVQ